MRVLLELLRIIFIFAILATLIGGMPHAIYSNMGIDTEKYGWTAMLGVFILIFVLYRNKLQFSGWYTGKGREKLPKAVSKTLIICAVFLIILMPIMYGASYIYDHTGSAGIAVSMKAEEKILVDDKHYINLRSENDPN